MHQSCGISLPLRREALEILPCYVRHKGFGRLTFSTALFTTPGYQYQMIDILVANFRQPKSTLLLLISVLIGPHWCTFCEHALADTHYRFLDYDDACPFYRWEL